MRTISRIFRLAQSSPRAEARLAGTLYLLVFVSGSSALAFRGAAATAANLISSVLYVAVTIVLYHLLKTVNRRVALLSSIFSIVGCILGALSALHVYAPPVSPFVYFGVYCLLTGYLVVESFFLPILVGFGMMIAGVGWLTWLSPDLARLLTPYNMVPGFVGELALTLWLIVVGVDEEAWREQAHAAGRRETQSEPRFTPKHHAVR